jgi:hypothetical protein
MIKWIDKKKNKEKNQHEEKEKKSELTGLTHQT